jgi:hypothetical protein
MERFKEGQQNKVTLESFRSEIFQLFVEFIYYGQYSCAPDTANKISEYAEAWVMGDYLDATDFKNFAMRKLYSLYCRPKPGAPIGEVDPLTIDYCCAMTPASSKLVKFYTDVLIAYWHEIDVIIYRKTHRAAWSEIWNEHTTLRDDVLYFTSQSADGRLEKLGPVECYLEKGEPEREGSVELF